MKFKYFNRILYNFGLIINFKPAVGEIKFGDFHRTVPFSRRFGIDRGGAIDRYFIEKFLENNKQMIRGRVLEVADNNYTVKFGGSHVTQSDILHANDKNLKATIVADLSQPMHLQENQFDCIILTQTLQFIFDCNKAIENCFRLLKPGGYLLLTVPGISYIGRDPFDWHWCFTTHSVMKILSANFKQEDCKVQSFGNVLVASAFLYGVGRTELKEKDMDMHDPSYQVIIAASAKKSNPNHNI